MASRPPDLRQTNRWGWRVNDDDGFEMWVEDDDGEWSLVVPGIASIPGLTEILDVLASLSPALRDNSATKTSEYTVTTADGSLVLDGTFDVHLPTVTGNFRGRQFLLIGKSGAQTIDTVTNTLVDGTGEVVSSVALAAGQIATCLAYYDGTDDAWRVDVIPTDSSASASSPWTRIYAQSLNRI